MIILGGLFFLIMGLLNLFAGDMVWSLTVLSNKWKGNASERTGLWDFRRKAGGVILLIFGVGLFVFGLVEPGMAEKREAERKVQHEQFEQKLKAQQDKMINDILNDIKIKNEENPETHQ